MVMLNFTASFQLIRTFGLAMAAPDSGRVVGFSSIRARTIERGLSVHAATKASPRVLVRTAAAEYGSSGVRVKAIRPGMVETPLTWQLRDHRDRYDSYSRKAALGRWARVDKLAGAGRRQRPAPRRRSDRPAETCLRLTEGDPGMVLHDSRPEQVTASAARRGLTLSESEAVGTVGATLLRTARALKHAGATYRPGTGESA